MSIAIQDKVEHPRFGPGTVTEVRHGGYEAKVNFNGYAIWVPAAGLRRLEQMPVAAAPRSQREAPAVRPDDYRTRIIIESLRLGIVPDFGLKEWTVGRDDEFARVERWLEEEAEGTLIVEGRYGSGKTHLLRYMAQRARESGYAVSMVRVDPGQENAAFPMRFYASCVRNLRIPYGGGSFELDDALRHIAGSQHSLAEHRFLGPMAERIRLGTETDADRRGLMGEKSGTSLLPSGLDFTTVANLACNLLSAVSHAVAHDLDQRGLLLLVDEVETAEVRRYSYHWQRTLNFLRGLSLVSNDDDELDEKVVKSSDGVRKGQRTGLVYSGHYPDVKYYYRFPSRLKVVLALTECRVSGRLNEWKHEQPRVALSDMPHSELTRLFHKVNDAYYRLYGVRVPDHLERYALYSLLFEAYQTGAIRGFGKALVELLDFLRHHPEEPLEALEAYREF